MSALGDLPGISSLFVWLNLICVTSQWPRVTYPVEPAPANVPIFTSLSTAAIGWLVAEPSRLQQALGFSQMSRSVLDFR